MLGRVRLDANLRRRVRQRRRPYTQSSKKANGQLADNVLRFDLPLLPRIRGSRDRPPLHYLRTIQRRIRWRLT